MADLSDREAAGDDVSMESTHTDDETSEARRIGDVAQEHGVSLRTLRFYEDKGLITPERVGNTRLYHPRDLSRLKLILLGRQVGFSLREVKQLLDLYDPNGSNIRQLKAVLDRSTRQMGRLEKQRVELEAAMEALGGLMETVRDQLAQKTAAKAS